MPIYKCNKCEYTTKVKQNLTKHINKKSPCKTELIIYDISNNDNDNEPIAIGSIEDETIKLMEEITELYDENNELREKVINYINKIKTLEKFLNELGYKYEIK